MRGLARFRSRDQMKRRQRATGRLRMFLRAAIMSWRRFRFGLRAVDSTFYMAADAIISSDLVARPYSFVGTGSLIGPGVILGKYAMIGPRVAIVGRDHRFDLPGVPIIFSGRPEYRETRIGDDAWIGCGAILI